MPTQLISDNSTPMIESLKLRTLVIGNSGSGKSTLAERLGALFHAPTFDLDLIDWKDDGWGAKQDEDAARQKVADLKETSGTKCGGFQHRHAIYWRFVNGLRSRRSRT